MTRNLLAPSTLERIHQYAHQVGVSADDLINRLLDSTPVPSPIPYSTIVNNMVDIIALITPDRRYALVNKAMQTVTGIPVGQIIGKTNRELGFPEDLIQSADATHALVMSTRTEQLAQFTFPSPDGIRFYEVRLSPIFDSHDEIIYLLSVTHDVTERRKSQVNLKAVLDSSLTGVTAFQAVRDESGEIIDLTWTLINQWAEKLSGYKAADIVGKRFLEKFPINRDNGIFDMYCEVIKTREPIKRTIYYTRPGLKGWFDVVVYPFEDGVVVAYDDITEQKLMQDALTESEARFRTMANAAPVLIWASGLDKLCNFFNDVWLNFTGRSFEQEYGNGWTEGVHPDDFDRCLNIYTSSFDARQQFHMDYRLRRHDGEYRWILDHGVPRFSAEGEFLGYIGSCIDITEKKQAEEAVIQSEANYRLLFQEAPISIWKRDFSQIKTYLDMLRASGVADIETYLRENPQEVEKCLRMVKTLEANHTALAMYKGKSIQEINDNFTKIVTLGEPQPASLTAVVDGKTSFSGEFINRALDGTRINILMKWIVLPGHEKTYDEVLVVTVDISDQKEAEEAIRQSEANYRLLFQEAPIAIWKQDFSGMKAFLDEISATGIDDIEAYLQTHPEAVGACLKQVNIHEANTTALEMYGATSVQTVNELFHQVIINDDPQQPASLAAIASGKTTFSGEFTNKTINGNTIYLLIKWLVMHGHEQTYDEVLVATLDITEQKRYELASIENERLTARFRKEQDHNALVQRSIAALSHDLRTPLSVIGMSKDLLLKYFDKLTEEKRKEKLEGIGRQLEFAMELLDDTVAMVRGALSERAFHPTWVNLAKLCQVSVSEVGMSYHAQKRLKFVNIGRVDMALIDEILVSRILLNLLSNAIKYSPNQTDIRLELDQNSEHLIIRVVDKGVGIHPDNLPHIFEAFYRVPETQNIQGTGLGLSIVKECVERHHGHIEVTSELGKGTTFTVELPLLIKEASVGGR
ncbi:MAG: PAS domain S-box protein [bacterium]|nr:PAS domain S-box protein [bacterium]